MSGQEATPQIPYRLMQLEWDKKKDYHNEVVDNFDDLVTHHPYGNRGAKLENGSAVGGQRGRTLGLVGGEFQEIEVAEPGQTHGLRPDQVLLKKDFLL
ncbi:hypothetical protein [Xanthomonas vesicatoria]|uniref:hypothetical protein n=1 Tax=Xanthomonas vesicatoria TaxID=56460 RepID=UPI001E3E5026|nr:hypothetical protein [Xanthomonas vesicatoria]MCC8628130.1 hypothetical protein [Xanthomonas vesicatoria]MDG4483213.1 hypothetical protein [Xanthomonas vesicatoria]